MAVERRRVQPDRAIRYGIYLRGIDGHRHLLCHSTHGTANGCARRQGRRAFVAWFCAHYVVDGIRLRGTPLEPAWHQRRILVLRHDRDGCDRRRLEKENEGSRCCRKVSYCGWSALASLGDRKSTRLNSSHLGISY